MSVTATLTQRRETRSTTAAAAAAAVASKRPVPSVSLGGQVIERVPATKPPFTVGDIRRAIPAHCFSKPLSKSFGYLLGDMIVAGLLYYATSFIPLLSDELFGSYAVVLRHVCWVAYWLAQGAVCTGLWVIGHECGHGGFADNLVLNHTVGLVVHSCLLVPYFSWSISHRRHHSNTGSVEHDEVFVPPLATAEQIKQQEAKETRHASGGNYHDHEDEAFMGSLISACKRLFWMTIMFTFGWPSYLILNISGNKSYDPKRWVNHFNPYSPIFTTGNDADAHNQNLIILSDLGLLAVFAVLYKLVQVTSLSYMLYVYFIPYLFVNFWLVLITYLQHTDLNLPHYTDGEWDWLRGALATVDRDYGFLNVVFHHITDTHVVHHLFSNMPHYHAEEATRAVRGLLGPYYRYDNTPVWKALWNAYRDCDVLFPDKQQKGVHWFEPK